jgi:hypothetical protein
MRDDKPVAVLMFLELDEVFRQVTGEGFWSTLEKHKVTRVAGWSQFLATRDVWERMMQYLAPFIEHLKDRRPSLAYHAHLIEMCWGYFCALENYQRVSFLKDGPPSTHLYGKPLRFDVDRFEGNYERILKGEMTVREAYQEAGLDSAPLEPHLRETPVSPVETAGDADARGARTARREVGWPRAVARALLPVAVRKRLWWTIGLRDRWAAAFHLLKSEKGAVIRRLVPRRLRRRLRVRLLKMLYPEGGCIPAVGQVEMGHWRRLSAISRDFGSDRGRPIDRYYIENFLQDHAGDVKGRVLELGDPSYTQRFGGSRVTQSDVLHAAAGNPVATVVGDLVTGAGVPREAYDCMIVTQGYHVIYDIHSAVRTTWEALKPGGVLLATIPCVSQISRPDMNQWGDYWRMTDAAARRLFGDVFGAGNVTVTAHGNVLVGCAFLQGLAWQELTQAELDHRDPDQQVLITIRAVRAR